MESSNDRTGDGLDWFNTDGEGHFNTGPSTLEPEQCFSPSGTPIPCL